MEKNEGKKQSWGLVTTLVVILFAVFCGFGYAVGGFRVSKSIIKNESNTTEGKAERNNTNITVYETTDEKITNVLKVLFSYPDCNVVDMYANDKIVEAKDITALQAYRMVESKYFDKDSMTLDEFQNAVHTILGKDYNIDPTSLDYSTSNCMRFVYDTNAKTFNKQETACGWTCGPVSTRYLVTRAVEDDGEFTITMRVAFGDGESTFYKDSLHQNKLATYNEGYDVIPFEQADAYKFTFRLEDGNYVFVSSELA